MLVLDYSKLEKVKKQNGKIICACPACRSEGRDSTGNHMVVYSNGAFGCCANPDKNHYKQILQLIGINNEDVNFELNNFVEENEIVLPTKFNKNILENMTQDHTYWINREINPQIFTKLTGGLINLPKLENRHTTVIYNEKNDIIGLAGRSTKPNPAIKWKILGQKSNFIYPYYYNKNIIDKTKSVILVESPGDLFSLMTCGIDNVLVMFGTFLNNKILNKLISLHLNKITICTNNDKINQFGKRPGQDAAIKIQKILLDFFDEDVVKIIHPLDNDLNEQLVNRGVDSIKELFVESI